MEIGRKLRGGVSRGNIGRIDGGAAFPIRLTEYQAGIVAVPMAECDGPIGRFKTEKPRKLQND